MAQKIPIMLCNFEPEVGSEVVKYYPSKTTRTGAVHHSVWDLNGCWHDTGCRSILSLRQCACTKRWLVSQQSDAVIGHVSFNSTAIEVHKSRSRSNRPCIHDFLVAISLASMSAQRVTHCYNHIAVRSYTHPQREFGPWAADRSQPAWRQKIEFAPLQSLRFKALARLSA